MWNSAHHPNEDNLRWALLRAIEWLAWPVFLSQVFTPILLCFYPWQWVIGALIIAAFTWRNFVASWWVSMIADYGPIFVLLKFISAPASALFLWHNHHPWISAVALLWPWIGPFLIGYFLVIPQALMEALTPLGDQAQIGLIQQRFMKRLGYTDCDDEL